MDEDLHLSLESLYAGLDEIRESPKDKGVVNLVLRRPSKGEREILEEAEIDLEEGVVGDCWKERGSRMTKDGSAHPEMQIAVANSRAVALVAQREDRWALAGDQLYLNFDISESNTPAGTRLAIGSAVLEVTPVPHNGCSLFAQRFGNDAMKFVNSPEGKELHLRGVNTKVVQPGRIRNGDTVEKV